MLYLNPQGGAAEFRSRKEVLSSSAKAKTLNSILFLPIDSEKAQFRTNLYKRFIIGHQIAMRYLFHLGVNDTGRVVSDEIEGSTESIA